jgi:Uma2 family endonuclease
MVAAEKGQLTYESAEPRPWRLTLEQFQHLAELGMFHGVRVELVNGVICEMSPESPRHANRIDVLHGLLYDMLRRRARVRMQHSFIVDSGAQLEPDLAVVAERDYDDRHPDEAFLIVEVADTSLAYDRGLKAAMYAQSGVPEYWVVNIRDRWIEVHEQPVDGRYTRVTPYKAGETIRLLAFPDVAIDVGTVIS